MAVPRPPKSSRFRALKLLPFVLAGSLAWDVAASQIDQWRGLNSEQTCRASTEKLRNAGNVRDAVHAVLDSVSLCSRPHFALTSRVIDIHGEKFQVGITDKKEYILKAENGKMWNVGPEIERTRQNVHDMTAAVLQKTALADAKTGRTDR